MRYLTLSLLLATWLASAGVQAADLADVYNSAKDHDPVLGAARAGYEASAQGVPQARSRLLPSLNAGGSSSWNERSFPAPVVDTQLGSPTFGQLVDVPDQEFNEHAWQAQLSQSLFNLESWHNLKGAHANVRRAEHSLSATEQTLIVRVVQAYLNVLRAQDLLESSQAEEAAVKRQLEQVQQRFDVGLVAITDVLEAQAAYDNSVVRRIQADGDHGIFFETLRTLTGEAYDTLDKLAVELPIINPEPAREEEWVTTALSTNLGILAAREALIAAERTAKARRSGHLPTLDATVTQSHFVTGGQSFLGGKTDQTTYAVQINVPVFQGGFTRARVKEANALAEQARQQLQDQQLTVARDTRNLFRAVATDVVRVNARAKAIQSSESALEATQTGYEVGTRNIVDVLQAQQRLYSSQFDYADSRYNYVLNLMRLKQVSGTLVDADIAELNQFTDPHNQVNRLTSASGIN